MYVSNMRRISVRVVITNEPEGTAHLGKATELGWALGSVDWWAAVLADTSAGAWAAVSARMWAVVLAKTSVEELAETWVGVWAAASAGTLAVV